MQKLQQSLRRALHALAAVTLTAIVSGLNIGLFAVEHAHADNLTTRKVTVSSSAIGTANTGAKGSGTNGAFANHAFSFTFASVGNQNVGSLEFLYCTTPIIGTTCTAPTGLDVSTIVSINGQTGVTGFTIAASTANRIRLTKTAAAVTAGTAGTYNFGQGAGTDWIKNPTTANQTSFVRITSFSDNAYTTAVDDGTVAFSTSTAIAITAKVQETLNFSVTAAAPAAPGGSCTALSGTGNIAMGDAQGILSITQAYDAHSYFRLATNSANGTVVAYSGDTLKKGAFDINSIGTTATASAVGSEQFGLGLDSADTQAGNGYSFTQLTGTAPYAVANGTITNGGTALFAHDTTSVTAPKTIATSVDYVACDTGSVRYLANISPNTAAGVYTTTIQYFATPTY